MLSSTIQRTRRAAVAATAVALALSLGTTAAHAAPSKAEDAPVPVSLDSLEDDFKAELKDDEVTEGDEPGDNTDEAKPGDEAIEPSTIFRGDALADSGLPERPWMSLLEGHDNTEVMWATAPTMEKAVPLARIWPEGEDPDAPRPTLYILNGADGGEGTASWLYQTDIVDYFSDKDVNVVIVQAGAFSYYTDWESEETEFEKQYWETFLTRELPEALEAEIGGNGKRGIVGMSMSASSVLVYAEQHPELYDGVASFSGCPQTSDRFGSAFVQLVLDRAGVDATDMWGEPGSDAWVRNDALVNADLLGGTPLFISTGNGLWGEWDRAPEPTLESEINMMPQRTTGSVIEAVTAACTLNLQSELGDLGVTEDIDFDFRNTGTHSWGYWQEDLHSAWENLFSDVLFDGDDNADDHNEEEPTDDNVEVNDEV